MMRTPTQRPAPKGGVLLDCAVCGAELGAYLIADDGIYGGTVLDNRLVELDRDAEGRRRFGLRAKARRGGSARRSRFVGSTMTPEAMARKIARARPEWAELTEARWLEAIRRVRTGPITQQDYTVREDVIVYCPRPGCEARHIVVTPTPNV